MDEETRKKLMEWNEQVGKRLASSSSDEQKVTPESSGANLSESNAPMKESPQDKNSAFYNPLTAAGPGKPQQEAPQISEEPTHNPAPRAGDSQVFSNGFEKNALPLEKTTEDSSLGSLPRLEKTLPAKPPVEEVVPQLEKTEAPIEERSVEKPIISDIDPDSSKFSAGKFGKENQGADKDPTLRPSDQETFIKDEPIKPAKEILEPPAEIYKTKTVSELREKTPEPAGAALEKKPNLNPLEENILKRQEENDDLLSRIRTYESDAAEAIGRKKTSLSSMVIAEQKSHSYEAQRKEEKPLKKKSKALFSALLSMALLAGGVGILYGWYTFVYVPQNSSVNVDETQTLIQSNKAEEFMFEFEDRQALVSFLDDKKGSAGISTGEIYSLVFMEEFETFDSENPIGTAPITSRTFLEGLSVNAPLPLYRSLEPEFAYGIHATDGGNQPFMVWKTSLYQNAFASMLSWERDLPQDLNFMLQEASQEMPQTEMEGAAATTTATSSEIATVEGVPAEEAQESLSDLEFEDEVIKNHDARVLRDEDGNIRLLYSFADERTLVITNNLETLDEIFRRMTLVEF